MTQLSSDSDSDEKDVPGLRIRNVASTASGAALSVYPIQSGCIWVTANTGNYARRRDVADNGGRGKAAARAESGIGNVCR